ncbi:MAG TPA: efflux RND transporter periplasmic adaptor subunit [Acetobacteraceae bacterium]|nr:efflux RND transporter periplasmic adaptor subunit [Acetobacteraceae bacterium]
MIARCIALSLALLVCLASRADAQPAETASVLVSTIVPRRGTVPEIVTAYGTATPGPGSTTTISLPRAGQVQALSAEPGVPVHAGDKLLTFAAAPAAVQAYQQAVAALELAKKERAHTAELLAQQLATRTQLAQADKTVADAEAALAAQRRENGGDSVQVVRAPFDGVVTAVAVKPGQRVAANAPLLSVARASGIIVSAGVEPSERAKLRQGEAAKLEPLQGGGAVEGTVEQVDAMLDPATRQVGVAISVPPGSVLPGAGYRALITVGAFEGWPVPRDAVLSDAKGTYVFQVANAAAHRVDVRIVGTFGETTVIDGPLDASRPVVTQGNYQLTDGEAVRETQGGAA